MVEREHRAAVTLYVGDGFSAGQSLELPEGPAHHVRVRRVVQGDAVRLLDGRGSIADGVVEAFTKRRVTVRVGTVGHVDAPPPLHLLVPVADRDRMLFAAEKCTELRVTSWRPVLWARSRSVSPRGEGDKFREKVVARMVAALEQSGSAWLPESLPEMQPSEALAVPSVEAARVLLNATGAPLLSMTSAGSMTIAVGPEGGFEPAELELATTLGWRTAALGSSVLRFETALIAATAVIRAQQHQSGNG